MKPRVIDGHVGVVTMNAPACVIRLRRTTKVTAWEWSVEGASFSEKGTIEADSGEEALCQVLTEVPGPWDLLDSHEEFSVTLRPVRPAVV